MERISRRGFFRTSAGAAALAAAPLGSPEDKEKGVAAENALFAGVALRDITPGPGIPMWGYSEREGPATGTLDSLWAKTVLFSVGEKRVALVALDLGRVPMPKTRERIRERARRARVDDVILMATHTHHAPVMEAEDAPYIEGIEDGIGECIEAAVENLQPVRIGVGRGEADIAHNRRLLLEDGRCMMMWRNAEKKPTSPVDREFGLVRIDTLEGKPLAMLVNFACHPVVMGQSNRQYSADYYGEMARIVTEKTGAECLFLQGACGNINPYLDKTHIDKGGVEAMRSVGREFADAVLKAFGQTATTVPATPSLAYIEKPVVVGTRFDLSNPAQVEALREVFGELFDAYRGQIRPDLTALLGVLVLNRNLSLAFMPGEMFVQFQLELKACSPVRDTFLVGYANDFLAYFPTIRDAAAGGYGGLNATYVGVGAGDKLVMEAAIEIGNLSGRLKSVYEPQDFVMLEEEEG